MSLHSRILLAAPFVALLALPMPELAQAFGPYFGVGLGQSDFRGACDGISAPDSCRDTDTGVKIFGGYQFNRLAACEFGYTDLGAARLHFFGTAERQRLATTGVGLTGSGMPPFAPHISLFRRLVLCPSRQ